MTTLLTDGWSLHLPGLRPADLVPEPLLGDWAHAESAPPERAREVLGRKGLLAVEPAVRLALCAVHRALGLPPGERPGWPVQPGTAVVACGDLAIADAVARITRTVAEEGGRAVSVLDAPNASANVVATTVALWFRCGGPNLMVCSGPASGLEGLRLASLLLRARRAQRVVLVGAEPGDATATALAAADGRALRAGAACLVLRRPDDGRAHPRAALIELSGRDEPGDAARPLHDFYGAQSVVDLALAAHLAVDEERGPVTVRCAGEHGARTARVGPAALSPAVRPLLSGRLA